MGIVQSYGVGMYPSIRTQNLAGSLSAYQHHETRGRLELHVVRK
jgi:hypothetical protein